MTCVWGGGQQLPQPLPQQEKTEGAEVMEVEELSALRDQRPSATVAHAPWGSRPLSSRMWWKSNALTDTTVTKRNPHHH